MKKKNQDFADEDQPSEKELRWEEYVRRREEEKTHIPLEGKDYLALFLAAIQTIFLPLVVVALVFLAVAIGFIFLVP